MPEYFEFIALSSRAFSLILMLCDNFMFLRLFLTDLRQKIENNEIIVPVFPTLFSIIKKSDKPNALMHFHNAFRKGATHKN